MPTANVLVFNKETIQTWQKTVALIQEKLAPEYDLKDTADRDIQTNVKKIDELNEKIKSFDNQLDQLSQLYAESDCVNWLRQNNEQKQSAEELGWKIAIGETVKASLVRAKEETETCIATLQIRRYKAQIQINDLERTEKKLTSLIKEGETFLNQLDQSPDALLHQLTNYIYRQVDHFDCEYASNQPITLRRQLTKLKFRLATLVTNVCGIDGTVDPTVARSNYLQLAGLLTTIYSDMAQMKRDAVQEKFLTLLNDMLNYSHIAFNGDLPDDFATHELSAYYYRKHYENYVQNRYEELTDSQLDEMEQRDFTCVHETLKNKLIRIQPKTEEEMQCKKLGRSLIAKIDHEKDKADKNKNEHFDIKYATTVLKKTCALMDDPLNARLQKQYRELADQDEEGKPSLAKIITGTLLALAGVLIVVASALLTPATFGASDVGVPVGIALAAQGACVALNLTGMSYFGLGFGLFADGVRKNISKKIIDFACAEQERASKPGTRLVQEQNTDHAIPPPLMTWVR